MIGPSVATGNPLVNSKKRTVIPNYDGEEPNVRSYCGGANLNPSSNKHLKTVVLHEESKDSSNSEDEDDGMSP